MSARRHAAHPAPPQGPVLTDASRRALSLLASGIGIGLGVLVPLNLRVALGGGFALLAIGAGVVAPRSVAYLAMIVPFVAVLSAGGLSIGRATGLVVLFALCIHLVRGRFWQTVRRRLWDSGPLVALAAGYAALAGSSLAWAPDPGTGLASLGALGLAMAFMIGIVTFVQEAADLRTAAVLVTLASAGLGVWSALGNLHGLTGKLNPAGDANFAATTLLVALPLVAAQLGHTCSAAGRAAIYGACALIPACVLLTLSRTGLVAAGAVLLALTVIPGRSIFGSRRSKGLALLVATATAALVFPFVSGRILARFQVLLAPGAEVDRSDLSRAALLGFAQHPVLGLGIGGFEATYVQLLRQTPGVNLDYYLKFRAPSLPYAAALPVHDAYVESLAELGVTGLLLFGGILLATGTSLLRTAGRARRAGQPLVSHMAAGLLVSLLVLAIAGTTLSLESSEITWVVIGLSVALRAMAAGPAPGPAPAPAHAAPTRPRRP